MNKVKLILNNEAFINGLFLIVGSLLTIIVGAINSCLKLRKSKKEIEYEKHLFFSKFNYRLIVFLESIDKNVRFDHPHIEYFHYEALANDFLEHLGSIKNTNFDKKTTNFLYNIYEKQRALCNDVFIVEEIVIEASQTETGYPEFIEEYHIDTTRMKELIDELRDFNLKIHNRLFDIK